MTTATENRATLVAAAAVLFVVLFGTLYVSAGADSIARQLDTSVESIAMVSTMYYVVQGATMILFGRLAQVVGYARTLVGATVVSAVAGVVALVPGGLTWLMASRLIATLAAAAAIPASYALVSQAFDAGQPRHRAFALLAAMTGAGGFIGAIAGALTADSSAWRLYLAVTGVGLGVVGIVVRNMLPRQAPSLTRAELDIPSLVLVAIGLVLASLAISTGHEIGWGTSITDIRVGVTLVKEGFPAIPVLLLVALIVFAFVFQRQRSRARAGKSLIVSAKLLRVRRFWSGTFVLCVISLTSSSALIASQLIVLYDFAPSARLLGMHAAMVSLGIAIGGLGMAPIAKRIQAHNVARLALWMQLALFVINFILFFVNVHSSPLILTLYFVFGVSVGLALAAINSLLLEDVATQDLSMASAVSQTTSNLASGLAISGTILIYVGVGKAVLTFGAGLVGPSQLHTLTQISQLETVTTGGSGQPLPSGVATNVLNNPAFVALREQVFDLMLKQMTGLVLVGAVLIAAALFALRSMRSPR